MKARLIASLAFMFLSCFLPINTYAANAGDFSGAIAVGTTYAGTAGPTNGAIFQGSVGVGSTSPTLAGLVVDKRVGNTAAMFSSGVPGLSIITNWPGVYFNAYFNGTGLFMGTGYAGLMNFASIKQVN